MEDASGCPTGLLDQPTLVLNRSWLPVHVTTVRRALSLLVRGAATVVQPETYETFEFEAWIARPHPRRAVIRTVRVQIPVPEVVVLRCYDRPARRSVPFTRRNLYRRDQLRCQYCGRRPGTRSLTIDHVLPRSLGGTTSWTNCVLACAECNGRKGGRTPEQVGMKLLKPPVRPRWPTSLRAALPSLHLFLSTHDSTGPASA